MFNIHKKCEARYNCLSRAYSECYDECAKLKEKVEIMKKDNADLAEMLDGAKLHIQALCLINSALMEVVTKKQKEKVCKIINKKDARTTKCKKLIKKVVKRGRKKKSK